MIGRRAAVVLAHQLAPLSQRGGVLALQLIVPVGLFQQPVAVIDKLGRGGGCLFLHPPPIAAIGERGLARGRFDHREPAVLVPRVVDRLARAVLTGAVAVGIVRVGGHAGGVLGREQLIGLVVAVRSHRAAVDLGEPVAGAVIGVRHVEAGTAAAAPLAHELVRAVVTPRGHHAAGLRGAGAVAHVVIGIRGQVEQCAIALAVLDPREPVGAVVDLRGARAIAVLDAHPAARSRRRPAWLACLAGW